MEGSAFRESRSTRPMQHTSSRPIAGQGRGRGGHSNQAACRPARVPALPPRIPDASIPDGGFLPSPAIPRGPLAVPVSSNGGCFGSFPYPVFSLLGPEHARTTAGRICAGYIPRLSRGRGAFWRGFSLLQATLEGGQDPDESQSRHGRAPRLRTGGGRGRRFIANMRGGKKEPAFAPAVEDHGRIKRRPREEGRSAGRFNRKRVRRQGG